MADHDNRTPPMLPDEVRKAVEAADRACSVYKLGFEGRRHWQTIKAHLLAREAEVERLQARVEREESDCLEVIQERDWAQDCLQKAHIALGGDGEWTCKMPSPEPPDSGDLHYDVPALAEEVRDQAERAEALLREVVAVAVTQLFDTHRTDVEATFSLAELQSMVELTEPLMEANTRVEAIYRKAFDFTAHLSENSRG